MPHAPEQRAAYPHCQRNTCHSHDQLPAARCRSGADTRGSPLRRSMVSSDRRKEPISAPRQRLDKSRVVSGVAQCLSELVYGCVQAVVEIDERILRPDLRAQLFARYHFGRPLKQDGKHLEWLFLQLDALTLFAQLSRAQVHLKNSKAQDFVSFSFHCSLAYSDLA